MQDIFAKWAEKDPTVATQPRCSQLSNPRDRSERSRDARNLVGKDPQTAIAWVTNWPPGKERDSAQEAIAQGWAQTDPQAALTWAQGMAPSQSKNNALQSIAQQLAFSDDPSVGMKLAQGLPNANMRNNAEQQIVRNWSQRSKAAGAYVPLATRFAEQDRPAAQRHQ